jgi:pimeloyl-ACP methyl ester carboxylesterase
MGGGGEHLAPPPLCSPRRILYGATESLDAGPTDGVRAPSILLFALEGQRAVLEAASLLPASPLLGAAPRGDGHPVLVLPGFTAGDESTMVLRFYLRRLGYWVHGWRLGRNFGFDGHRGRVHWGLARRIEELVDKHDKQKLSLVGWSLGGIYAREIARAVPDRVRQVITLGSPFAGAGRGSNVDRLYKALTGGDLRRPDPELLARICEPPPVPSTAIFSRSDGVAHWRACLERPAPHTDNIEVRGSHCGLGFNPVVLYAIADRLAQPEGEWRPFSREGWRRFVYR